MPAIGVWEIAIICGIALLIFGPRQLPKLGRSIGESIREFRNVGKQISEGLVEDDERRKDA